MNCGVERVGWKEGCLAVQGRANKQGNDKRIYIPSLAPKLVLGITIQSNNLANGHVNQGRGSETSVDQPFQFSPRVIGWSFPTNVCDWLH